MKNTLQQYPYSGLYSTLVRPLLSPFNPFTHWRRKKPPIIFLFCSSSLERNVALPTGYHLCTVCRWPIEWAPAQIEQGHQRYLKHGRRHKFVAALARLMQRWGEGERVAASRDRAPQAAVGADNGTPAPSRRRSGRHRGHPSCSYYSAPWQRVGAGSTAPAPCATKRAVVRSWSSGSPIARCRCPML